VLLEELPGLRSDLADRDALIVDLEEEIRELDAELGGTSADRSNLIRRLEQQARVREQFRQVENMFTNSEALVLREGNRLIARLVGLNFASNSAELGTDNEALLAKVQSAIDVFPQCELTIEGHTDATGNAGKNMTLSEERAQAVKTYMTEVMRIPAFRIAATGYGDTRPIANNKTEEGRARNRRIDLIIAPKEL
jgi:OOP family OmpA-OmpF porin